MTPKTILVVEDSTNLAESLNDMLTIAGHKTIVATSGREAIDLAFQNKPDLILLDIRLPDIDGYEVYRQIKERSGNTPVHIVVLTASESIENISKNIDLPQERILFKPDWSVPDLLKKIESFL